MEPRKKLFVVKVEFAFPVLAYNEDQAVDALEDVARDIYLPDCASARLVRISDKGEAEHIKGFSPTELVYGVDEDVTLGDAIELEKQRRREEEMAKKQGNLF